VLLRCAALIAAAELERTTGLVYTVGGRETFRQELITVRAAGGIDDIVIAP